MNLQQILTALEQNNIQTTIDVGVHTNCNIDSNCPLAVEIRRIINESSMTLEQLLEGFAQSQEPEPDPLMTVEFPEIDAKSMVKIGEIEVEVDFSNYVREGFQQALADKLMDIHRREREVHNLSTSLYNTYLTALHHLKNDRTLPQLEFSLRDLIKAGCLITTDNDNYLFLFPRTYSPMYVISDGIRYALPDSVITEITRDMYIEYTITKSRKILRVHALGTDGRGLNHYHGDDSGDCWGMVVMPETWDGTLQSLTDLTTQIMGALATINRDSLLNSNPPGMPSGHDLVGMSTRLGEEGVRNEGERTRVTGQVDEDTTAPRRWGAPRRG